MQTFSYGGSGWAVEDIFAYEDWCVFRTPMWHHLPTRPMPPAEGDQLSLESKKVAKKTRGGPIPPAPLTA